jgi:hypothetical protein
VLVERMQFQGSKVSTLMHANKTDEVSREGFRSSIPPECLNMNGLTFARIPEGATLKAEKPMLILEIVDTSFV